MHAIWHRMLSALTPKWGSSFFLKVGVAISQSGRHDGACKIPGSASHKYLIVCIHKPGW